MGPAAGTLKYNMYYAGPNVGIDTFEETGRLAVEFGVVSKAGAWLSHEDKQWQGSKALGVALREDPVLYIEIQKRTQEAMTSD